VRSLLVSLLLLTPSLSWSLGFSCDDFNVILCVDFSEGGGTTARDRSKLDLTANLVGGPLWLTKEAAYSNWGSSTFAVSQTSASYANINGNWVFVTGLPNEEMETSVTTAMEFNGNKPFMIMFVAKKANLVHQAGSMQWVGWNQGLNNRGFAFESDANKTPAWVWPGIVANNYDMRITDTRPHTWGLWRDAGTLRLYFDGRLITVKTGVPDMNAAAGGSEFTWGKDKTGATTEFIGGFGRTQVWNAAIEVGQADGFFKAWHDLYSGNE